jgi:hypothetical protein
MRRRVLSSASVLLGCAGLAFAPALHADKPRKPTPPLPAAQYPMHDTHAGEQVTIAAEPGDTKRTQPNTRLDYYDRDMMPIRVIVTNDSSRTLTLDDARIDFIAADNAKIPAATDDDLNRRLFEMKQVKGTKIPLPAPLPTLTIHHKPIDTKILADDHDFGFTTTTVPPHSTVAGYLFYDMQGLDTPPLKNATLELREVRWAGPHGSDGDALDSFEIPLEPGDGALPPKD